MFNTELGKDFLNRKKHEFQEKKTDKGIYTECIKLQLNKIFKMGKKIQINVSHRICTQKNAQHH